MGKDLSKSLQKTFESKCDETLEEIVGSDLPSLVDGTLFVGIPVLSVAISIFKIGKSVRETAHIRKIARFLLETIDGKDSQKLKKYAERIREEEDFAEKEIEYIVLILDRYFEDEKASLLAKLFSAFLDKKIDWKMFKTFSSALDTIFLEDIELLKFYTISMNEYGDIRTASIARLQSVGFMIEKMSKTNFYADQSHALTIQNNQFREYVNTQFGRLFYSIIKEQ